MTEEERRRRLRLLQAQERARTQDQPPLDAEPPQQEGGIGRSIYENVIGSGEVDTPGERAGELIKGTAAGAVRGIAAVPGVLGDMYQGAAGLGRNLGGRARDAAGLPPVENPPSLIERAVGAMPTSADTVGAAGALTGGASDYVAPGTGGEFASTLGEFAGGAGIMGGPRSVVRYGLIPGAASEAAGQATEGTAVEPYARIGAALTAGTLAGKPSGRARPILPTDPDDARMAETLMRRGVRPTVGQTTGSSLLRKMEGSEDLLPSQLDDFTRASLKTAGSTARRATPPAMKEASDRIVGAMDDAVAGVSLKPSPAMAQQADDVVTEYLRSTAQGNIVPDVRNIADEIIDAATNPNAGQLSLATLKDWRSRLGRLMKSGDSQVRDGAYGLRNIIDDATTAELKAAGRADDVAKLTNARREYRNWLAVADASTRAGAESGRISPTQLNQSVIRSQGRRNAAVGNTTELGELSRAGAGIMRPEPTVMAGGARTISPEAGGGIAGLLAGAQLAPQSPAVGALVGGLAGTQGVNIAQGVMRSAPVQSTMMDPIDKILRALLRTGPAAMTGN